MQNLTHLQTCLDDWIGAITSSHPQEETALELLSSIRETTLPTLILAYTVGCLQDREHLAATGKTSVDVSSAQYAKLQWATPIIKGFLPTLGRAL